jgi:hypothetical protein
MARAISFGRLIAAFAISVLLFVPLALWLIGVEAPRTIEVKLPPSIAQIQSMSELATTRVHLTDSIEGENAHYIGRWILHGEVVLGVDLSAAHYTKVDVANQRATLRLPQPHQITSKVDHDHSEEIAIRSKVWFPASSEQLLRDEVWRQADRKIQRLGEEVGFKERAKLQAERALDHLFQGVGWTVDFEWR